MTVKNSIKIRELLDDFYEIPDYQRNYQWTKDVQIVQLWEDILEAKDTSIAEYFFGPIVLSKDEDSSPFTVVDGQQRLATITIFLAAIRDNLGVLKDDAVGSYTSYIDAALPGKPPEWRLTMNNTDRTYFELIVEKSQDPSEKIKRIDNKLPVKSLQESQKLLRDCYVYFNDAIQKVVAKFSTPDKSSALKDLGNTVLQNFKVLVIEVTDMSEAYRVFTSINAKGLDLASADLIKVHLYSKAGFNMREVKEAWESMLETLQKKNVSDFIRRHWLSTRGPVSERELFDKISKATKKALEVLDHTKMLSSEASRYIAIIDPRGSESSEFINSNRKTIEYLSDLLTLGSEVHIPVLLSGIICMKKDFEELAHLCLKLFFRYKTICNYHANDLTKKMTDLAVLIRKEKGLSIPDVKEKLMEINPSNDEFKNSFINAQIRKPIIAKYILTQINQNLKHDPSKIDTTPVKEITLEHIMPQNESAQSWMHMKTIHEEFVHRLGNLTLLQQTVNREAQDKSFVHKKNNYYAKSELGLNKALSKHKTWGREQIIKRQESFAEVATRIWRL